MQESSSRKRKYIWIIIIVLIVIIGVGAYFKLKIFTKPNQAVHLSHDEIKSNIIVQNTFVLPEAEKVSTSSEKLPSDLETFIISNPDSVSAASFPDNKTGYIIKMSNVRMPIRTITSSYIKLGIDHGYKVDKASFSTGYSLVSLSSSTYSLQMEAENSGQNDDYYSVTLNIIKK